MLIKKSFILKLAVSYLVVILVSFGFITFFLDRSLEKDSLQNIHRIVSVGLFLALALAFVLGLILARQTIRPVRRMISVAQEFAQGDFSRRVVATSHDEIGQLAAIFNKMAQDIEEEISLARAQGWQLEAVFRGMIEGVLVVDAGGRVVRVNPAVETIFGIAGKEAQGKLFLEAIRNNDIAEVINAVLREGRFVSGETGLSHPSRKVFRVNAAPLLDAGAVRGCVVVIHDITQIKRLEAVRSDFVANVSHELKTPLTAIQGYVETLLEGALDDKENNRNFLKVIQENAGRLSALVDDLLALSHLESREAAIEKEQLDLRGLLEEVVAGFETHIARKKVEVRNEIPAGLSVRADKKRIEQVLTNLIDNAVKFNKEKGFIRITAGREGGGVKIAVEDSGIGIPEKDLSRIFERFYRVDKARSRALGGTGLGLSIVKHIVELHGGGAGAQSIEGLGSTFWFVLPGLRPEIGDTIPI